MKTRWRLMALVVMWLAVASACSTNGGSGSTASPSPGVDAGGDASLCAPGETQVGQACVASSASCPEGQVKFGNRCVSPSGTVRLPTAASETAAVEIGDTGARLIVPSGATTVPVDVQWSVRTLTPAEQSADGLLLAPQEIDLGPQGTTFASPIVLEIPIAWPSAYDAMTTSVRTLWVPTYSRSSGGLVRDTLTTMGGSGGLGWVILDASRSPRTATALVPVDHFSSHTFAIPTTATEFSGQAAFVTRDVTGSTFPLRVPEGLFAHGVLDIITLDNPALRQQFYVTELMELARQTQPERDALWTGFDYIDRALKVKLDRGSDAPRPAFAPGLCAQPLRPAFAPGLCA